MKSLRAKSCNIDRHPALYSPSKETEQTDLSIYPHAIINLIVPPVPNSVPNITSEKEIGLNSTFKSR
jgi:hypothetical protein